MKKSTLFLLAIALALLALGSVAWAVAARQPSVAELAPPAQELTIREARSPDLGRSGSLETSQVTVIRSTNAIDAASTLKLVSQSWQGSGWGPVQDSGDPPLPPTGTSPDTIPPVAVPFLGQNVRHQDFPLVGGHGELLCQNCHSEGVYAGTEKNCSSCHADSPPMGDNLSQNWMKAYILLHEPQPESVMFIYPDHFEGECEDCHDIKSWEVVTFDHEGVSECLSCHAGDIPVVRYLPDRSLYLLLDYLPFVQVIVDEDHYPGDCSLCHASTTDWEVIEYGHENVYECESCHGDQAPQSHYPGSCASCHLNPENWLDAIYNHAEFKDCLGCHLDDTPDDHDAYLAAGQCSSCHSTESWGGVRFSHVGNHDCANCHTEPTNHYGSSCGDCHSTRNWTPDQFIHTSTSNCAHCHIEPQGHYPGDCTDCHNVRSWRETDYEHDLSLECAACHAAPAGHYPGDCASCHALASWTDVTFDHLGYTDCQDCHAADEPADHYAGECYNCHNVKDWKDASMFHSETSDCLACHTAPEEHYTGQCSSCHATSDWETVAFNHAGLTDCTTCHTAPSGHWPGECANCHGTTDWLDYTFDHTGYATCNACHARPASHPRGQCSKCHTTDSWKIIVTPTPIAVVSTATPGASPTPTEKAKPGKSSTPTPSQTPEQSATPVPPTLTPSPLPPTETPISPTDTPLPSQTPEPSSTPELLPVEPPEILPVDGTLEPARTVVPATPVLVPMPQETLLPLMVPTGAPLTGGAGPLSGDETALDYSQIITRLIDRTIRQIQVFLNPGGVHDPDLPPEYRLPVAPDAR
jgi:hypothetical protein